MFRPGVSIWYNVKNLEDTITFYTEKLGFRVLNHNPAVGQARLATNTEDC